MTQLGLGRRVPNDWTHVDRYALTPETTPAPPTPVAIGINWYTNFDTPERVGNLWYIGRGNWGSLRGGHCVCIRPDALKDPLSWWDFYNQGAEGACVGFGCSRLMSLMNRRRYDARWLWDMAKKGDDWPDTNPGDDNGTSVRAAGDVLRTVGHVRWHADLAANQSDYRKRDAEQPDVNEGIATNRWARSVDEVRAVLSSPSHDRRGAVPILNNWGRVYPHNVWLPYEALEILIQRDGEVMLVTDR